MKKGHKKTGPKKHRAESRDDMIVTTVALDREVHRRLAIIAAEDYTVITELIRQAVAEWLDRREGRTKRKGRR
jgi:hypothetical protein